LELFGPKAVYDRYSAKGGTMKASVVSTDSRDSANAANTWPLKYENL
jgi:hypothetical protein